MDENIFFRWIWRLNAVGLAAFLIAAGYSLANFLFLRDNQVLSPVEPPKVPPATVEMSLTLIDSPAARIH
jgi:hypothetical protein